LRLRTAAVGCQHKGEHGEGDQAHGGFPCRIGPVELSPVGFILSKRQVVKSGNTRPVRNRESATA
jgi:hypothetical protein